MERAACNPGISIHAPRVGSDDEIGRIIGGLKFQSTLPAWGATSQAARGMLLVIIFQSTLPAWGATLPPFSPPSV